LPTECNQDKEKLTYSRVYPGFLLHKNNKCIFFTKKS